ncbi:trigger factor [bacterium]|nr:trigger factor [bacterium]
MKAEVERLEECKVALKIEVPADKVREELDKLYNDLQKKANLPGFRRGKVPLDVLKTYFERSIRADALDRLIPDAYQKALKENDFIPCSQPKIEEVKYEDNKPLNFKATVEIKPKIILKRYKGLKAKRIIKIITEEDVNRALERLASRHAEFISVENRPTKKGDWVIIDFVGSMEGKPFKDNEAKNFSLEIGSKTLIGDFEDQLIGLKKGEEKGVRVKFPEDYHNEELTGKEVLFKVNLKEIKEKKLPELNDEFAKDLKSSSLKELKRRIREDLERYEREHSERILRDNLMDWLIRKTSFPFPQAMVERELEAMIEEALTRMRYSGIDTKRMGIEETKLKEKYRPSAERKVKNTLILEEIAKQENIEVNEEEIEKRIQEMALSTGQKKEDLRDFFNKERSHLAGLKEEIRLKKALDFIINEARIKEVTQKRRLAQMVRKSKRNRDADDRR